MEIIVYLILASVSLGPLSVSSQRSCRMDDGRLLGPDEEIDLGSLPCVRCKCDGATGSVTCAPPQCPELFCGADEGQLVEPGACCPTCVREFSSLHMHTDT
ncbi:unnamed protein product [Dicrocoelium dendriticum]|nr:unnamed protein product [Dicrocoelium dendriticum]